MSADTNGKRCWRCGKPGADTPLEIMLEGDLRPVTMHTPCVEDLQAEQAAKHQADLDAGRLTKVFIEQGAESLWVRIKQGTQDDGIGYVQNVPFYDELRWGDLIAYSGGGAERPKFREVVCYHEDLPAHERGGGS